jgi:Ca2+-binding RTX toxin-like protein
MANFYGADGDDSTVALGPFVNYYGGNGNDFLTGSAGPNEVYGGQGNDVVLGAIFLTFSGTGTAADP